MRRALVVAGCALVALAAPSAAEAHAFLIASTPTWGGMVETGPQQLRLVFSENVVPQYARVTVAGPRGQELGETPSVAGQVVTVPVRASQGGSYTVRWRMVASDDGHATEGVYSFGVRVKPLAPAPVKGLGVPVAPQVLAWLQFVGVALAGGMLVFRALVLAPSRRALGDVSTREARVSTAVAAGGAVVALHASLLGFLVGAYPIVGGGISGFVNTEIEPIRMGTHLGQAWMLTTFAWLGLLMLLVGAWVSPRRRERLLAGAGMLGLLIAFGISWASHPDSRGTLALLADYGHLVAAALWVGGVVAITIMVAKARTLPRSTRDAIARRSVLRFSQLALPTVVAVGLLGIYLAIRELPSPSALFSSSYGVTLLVKTAIVLAALALGAYHRRFVVPRIANGAPAGSIRNTLAFEMGVLLVVLVLAAILSQTAPPG